MPIFPLLPSILLFLLGLCAGSFLNVYTYRVREGVEGILDGRSFCPRCKTLLSPAELIPLFSFLFLKGRCAHCRQKISWRYPTVELLTGLAFVATYLANPNQDPVVFALELGTVFLLLTLAVYDIETLEIPLEVVTSGTALALIALFYRSWSAGNILPLVSAYVSLFIAVVFFGSQTFLSKERWMGRGDLYVGIFIALVLSGWQEFLLMLFCAYVAGATVGIVLLFQKRKQRKMPLVPFLAAGTFAAMVWGNPILSWYAGMLGM